MDSKQIIKRLRKDGFTKSRSKGSHQQWVKGSRRVTVKHPAKDFPIKTLKSMYEQAGWEWPPK